MLGGFAADKRTARLNAALGDTLNNGGYLFGNVFADCDVVKEKQGLRAAADDVVYAHCDRVDTDRVVLVEQKSQLDFCADAVGAAYEDRLLHTLEVGSEQSAEAADARNNALDIGARNVLFHKLNAFVACGDVYARRLVTLRKAFHN